MQRRKTLANALQPLISERGLNSREVLSFLEINPMRRPETLELDEISALTRHLCYIFQEPIKPTWFSGAPSGLNVLRRFIAEGCPVIRSSQDRDGWLCRPLRHKKHVEWDLLPIDTVTVDGDPVRSPTWNFVTKKHPSWALMKLKSVLPLSNGDVDLAPWGASDNAIWIWWIFLELQPWSKQWLNQLSHDASVNSLV